MALFHSSLRLRSIPRRLSRKESACQRARPKFHPWVGKMPWRRQWHPTPVFLPGKSQGQRSLVGCSPWGCKRAGRDLATKQFIWRCQVLVEPGKVSLVSHRIFHCTLSICGAQASEGSGSAVGAGGCSHPWGLWDLPRQQ